MALDAAERALMEENNALLHQLKGFIGGLDGQGGMIEKVDRTSQSVETIGRIIPTLVTKDSCAAARDACNNGEEKHKDRRWMRGKDAILILIGLVGGLSTIIGILRAIKP